jgi:hypothetical protein
MIDILYFLAVPFVALLIALLTYRGDRESYMIVKETNNLGESKYEVWFKYFSIIPKSRNWRLEETFATEQLAEDFVSRQTKSREVIKEGKLREPQ